LSWLAGAGGALAGGPEPLAFSVRQDHFPDAVMRLTNPDPGGTFDPALHRLPDLRTVTLGAWQPTDPQQDLFDGSWDVAGAFFRLELVFDGLLNPPGPVGLEGGYVGDPYAFGPHPVFGFLELDMDGNADTGGELLAPACRYLGNVGRFGGRLSVPPALANRMAAQAGDIDEVFNTPPFVERSGEEFHLALLGEEPTQIEVLTGNPDLLFEPGETWKLHGQFLHRAHGYEPFSFASGPQGLGIYQPQVELVFAHDPAANLTRISLVYPLNNAGSAAQLGDPAPQPNNGNPADQNSVAEALDDLHFSALHATPASQADPAFALISAWASQNPSAYLVPRNWSANMLVGTIDPNPQGSCSSVIWTDVFPDALGGDFDGDGALEATDALLLSNYINAHDGLPAIDIDGVVNGVVALPDFAANFCLFDTNYDGLVEPSDQWPPVLGDANADGYVNLADYALLLNCLSGPITSAPSACDPFDTDHDHDVDLANVAVFQRVFNGP
jgi:hypothetical protein